MWNNLGNTLGDMGGLAQAAAACRQALAVDPRLFSAHTNLANALGRGGDLHGAARHYREAIAINPEFADAHNNLGTTLHGMGDMDGAEASLRRALELSPDYAEAHSNLGSVLGEKEMWREAAAELTEAVRLRPDYAAAHWNLGLVLLMLGDLERGWAEYDWRRRVSGLIVPLLQFARPAVGGGSAQWAASPCARRAGVRGCDSFCALCGDGSRARRRAGGVLSAGAGRIAARRGGSGAGRRLWRNAAGI
jgi:Tfp pilus assembly protein PilF